MPPLASDLRRRLESVVVQARDLAETAAGSALQRWAVDTDKPFGHFSLVDREFRKQLRARGIQAGDRRHADDRQEIDQLTQELAYEYWHRMLFARFLAENHLLMHPDGVVVTLAECEELAPSERAPNGFVLAARYASRMLPQIFRIDDVLLDVELPANDRLPLERLLAGLPSQVFTADDSLGWVYQFWQSMKKDEVNKSGQKIDGRTLPAVTQLFTEHYMVEFLLHNTIGAWWSARHGLKRSAELEPRKEENGRDIEPRMKHGLNTDKDNNKRVSDSDPCFIRVSSVAENEFVSSMAKRFTYLRWRDDGTPAAGTFEGWPKTLREFTMLDPCCGSGHFLVAGFHLLVPLRMHDEGLSAKEAVDAVLRENLFGLEIDPRCTQIAAFALAMAAWKFSDENGEPLGYRELPPLSIACSGQGVVGTKEDWARFADGDSRFNEGMERLYDLFQKAPSLGSLIEPRTVADDLFTLGFDALKGTLDRALKKTETKGDPDRSAVGVAAQGIALAASLMSRQFTVVATTVQYLARGKHAPALREYLEEAHPEGKADLATAFLERCRTFCVAGGSMSIVSPQNWWFLGSYECFRRTLLKSCSWHMTVSLSEEAWHAFGIRGPKATLLIVSNSYPGPDSKFVAIEASDPATPEGKAEVMRHGRFASVVQSRRLTNPDFRISMDNMEQQTLLNHYCHSHNGMTIGDQPRLKMCFWELIFSDDWIVLQSTTGSNVECGGLEHVLYWCNGNGPLDELPGGFRRGEKVWGRAGVVVSPMRDLPVTRYFGHGFDVNVSVIVPFDPAQLPAIWCFCKSPEFQPAVRRIDQKLNVTNATLVKVPFDLERWQQVAAEEKGTLTSMAFV